MARAENQNTTTRRTLLKGAAAYPVVAATLASGTAIGNAASGDAGIIATGEKFQALMQKYMSAWLEWGRLMREAHAETKAKFGPRDRRNPAWMKPYLQGNVPRPIFSAE